MFIHLVLASTVCVNAFGSTTRLAQLQDKICSGESPMTRRRLPEESTCTSKARYKTAMAYWQAKNSAPKPTTVKSTPKKGTIKKTTSGKWKTNSAAKSEPVKRSSPSRQPVKNPMGTGPKERGPPPKPVKRPPPPPAKKAQKKKEKPNGKVRK